MSSNITSKNLVNAQTELRKVIGVIADVQKLYLKPARLNEENRATTRAIDNLNRAIQRMEKRIEILRELDGVQQL